MPASPNTIVAPTISPINSTCPTVTSIFTSLPSAKPYIRCPLGERPMASRCYLGTRQSTAPVSTGNRPSQVRSGSAGFRMIAVTWVTPI